MNDEKFYSVKTVEYRGRRVDILLQAWNGPCALIAVANVLLLSGKYSLPPRFSAEKKISEEDLLTSLCNHALDTQRLRVDHQCNSSEFLANQEHQIKDIIALLPTAIKGVDVNCRFDRPDAFEFTEALSVFDLFGIKLYHGWIADPSSEALIDAIEGRSYNELVCHLVPYVHVIEAVALLVLGHRWWLTWNDLHCPEKKELAEIGLDDSRLGLLRIGEEPTRVASRKDTDHDGVQQGSLSTKIVAKRTMQSDEGAPQDQKGAECDANESTVYTSVVPACLNSAPSTSAAALESDEPRLLGAASGSGDDTALSSKVSEGMMVDEAKATECATSNSAALGRDQQYLCCEETSPKSNVAVIAHLSLGENEAKPASPGKLQTLDASDASPLFPRIECLQKHQATDSVGLVGGPGVPAELSEATLTEIRDNFIINSKDIEWRNDAAEACSAPVEDTYQRAFVGNHVTYAEVIRESGTDIQLLPLLSFDDFVKQLAETSAVTHSGEYFSQSLFDLLVQHVHNHHSSRLSSMWPELPLKPLNSLAKKVVENADERSAIKAECLDFFAAQRKALQSVRQFLYSFVKKTCKGEASTSSGEALAVGSTEKDLPAETCDSSSDRPLLTAAANASLLVPQLATYLEHLNVVKTFLQETAHQLTPDGLDQLTQIIEDEELVVVFRNNHFAVVTKHEGALYSLVTDVGYEDVGLIVWEMSQNLFGGGCLCTGNFEEVPHEVVAAAVREERASSSGSASTSTRGKQRPLKLQRMPGGVAAAAADAPGAPGVSMKTKKNSVRTGGGKSKRNLIARFFGGGKNSSSYEMNTKRDERK